MRELWEEIGLRPEDFRVVEKHGPYRYQYGKGRRKKGFHGKEQHYFLADFLATDARINVKTAHPEFQAFRWILPEDFQVSWLPEMKREVYSMVFMDFFSVKIR